MRADPGREDHDHFRSWVGGTFDPAAFDLGWSTPGCGGCADQAGWSGGFAAAAGLGGTEPEAVGAGLDDVGVERDPVDDGGDQAGVGDDGALLAEGEVAGQRHAGFLLEFGEDLEQQLGAAGIELHLAELVDLCRCPHSWTYADTATMPRCRR